MEQPPAPVPVAWSVVPVDFKVFKKGTEMAMHDATGRLAFRVAGDGGGGGGTVLFDGAGGVLVNVRTSGQGEWQAFSGNSLEHRHVIFTAKVMSASSSRKETNLLYKLKKTIYSRRKFRVTIYPGNDNTLVMAMIMTFFVEK